jgi:hypothetical protein
MCTRNNGGGERKFEPIVSGAMGVKSKPRDLGNDRGYRVIVEQVWVWIRLNPHPLKTDGAAPKLHLVD